MRTLNCGCKLRESGDRTGSAWTVKPMCAHHTALLRGEAEPTTKYDKAWVSSQKLLPLLREQLRLQEKLAAALLVEQSDKAGDV